MTYREKRKAKKAEKNGEIELFKKLYDPKLSFRDNLKVLNQAGVTIKSIDSVKKWAEKYYKPVIEETNDQPFHFPFQI